MPPAPISPPLGPTVARTIANSLRRAAGAASARPVPTVLVLLLLGLSLGLEFGLSSGSTGAHRATTETAPLSTSPAAASASETPVTLGVSISNRAAPAGLNSYTAAVGHNPAIVMWFQSFDEPLFYPKQLPVVAALGAVPMITWDPAHRGGESIPLRDVAAGNYDDYVRQAAAAAASWGKPLFVRFAEGMNLGDSPWGPGVDGNTAADYIAAWRHVVSIFRDAGATNVLWVWSPYVECSGACPFANFYPGDAWVDWVALDGYNHASIDDVPWLSVSEIFGSSYDDLTELTNKPVMIAETASTEVGGDKAAWITQGLLSDVPTRLPRVRALVWFQRDKETDWRVNSSPAALEAFRSVADNPLYAGSAADLVTDTSNPQPPASPPIGQPQPSSGQPANGSTPQQGQGGAPGNGTAGVAAANIFSTPLLERGRAAATAMAERAQILIQRALAGPFRVRAKQCPQEAARPLLAERPCPVDQPSPNLREPGEHYP